MLTVCLVTSTPFPHRRVCRGEAFFIYAVNFSKTLYLNASPLLRLFPDELKFIEECIYLIEKIVGAVLFILGIEYTIKNRNLRFGFSYHR